MWLGQRRAKPRLQGAATRIGEMCPPTRVKRNGTPCAFKTSAMSCPPFMGVLDLHFCDWIDPLPEPIGRWVNASLCCQPLTNRLFPLGSLSAAVERVGGVAGAASCEFYH